MADLFKKEETDAVGGYQIVYYHNNIRQKVVNETKPSYTAWLAEPNTPEVITFVPPAAPTFEENRAERINQIQGNTGILLADGQEYPAVSGNFMYLLPHDNTDPQSDYMGLDLMHTKGTITYPCPIPLLDGTDYGIVDSTDWIAFFATVSARMFDVRTVGRDLITSLVGAVDQAALDAIVDNRS